MLGKNLQFSGTFALSKLLGLNVDARIAFKIVNGNCTENMQLQFRHSKARSSDVRNMLETLHYNAKYGGRIFGFNRLHL